MESQKIIKGTKAGKITAQVLLHSSKRYIVNEGGTRSGKTFGTMQVLIWYASKHKTEITVVSRSLPHLKDGAMKDFMDILKDWDWYNENDHNMSDNIYVFPETGSMVKFQGLEDEGKARGPGRDILFINEANMVKKSVFDQLAMRTRGKIILDLNPSDFDCWCYQVADSANAVKIHSTYKDNPFLPQAQIQEIENYQNADETLWKVFGLGLRGASAEQIYTHWKLCDNLPEKGDTWYGLDFGYTVPTAMVKVVHYEGAIYAQEMLYQTNLTTQDRIEKLKAMGIKRSEIYADAAEPASIEEMYRAGFNIKPADKDVWAGILKVKSLPLYVTRDSLNLKKELGTYKWKKDKNDKVLEEPIKEHDHLCDALRYAVFTKLSKPALSWTAM